MAQVETLVRMKTKILLLFFMDNAEAGSDSAALSDSLYFFVNPLCSVCNDKQEKC
jgi:hypothetical protein